MRRHHLPWIVLGSLALAGCGEDPGVESGSVPFKAAPTAGLDSMKAEMQKNMREKAYLKKDDEPGKPAAAPREAGESKSSAETKPATKGG
jgi:hypothetical protein